MMKNRKHEPILFSYRDCDDFAAYLEEQARLGWHFKEIHMGLVFERGKPAEIRYRVEVFPKRREEDDRPTGETKEYAAYCEAAGWKFVGSVRKFCIFEQMEGEAVPIVTDEERLANVVRAERGILATNWWETLTIAFNLTFFAEDFPMMVPIMLAVGICVLVRTISLVGWSRRWRRRLREGKGLRLASRGGTAWRVVKNTIFECLVYVWLCISIVGLISTAQIGWIGAGIWVMVLMVFGVFLIFSNWFRGSDTFSGVLMVICLLAIMAAWGLSMGEGLAELTGTANRPI